VNWRQWGVGDLDVMTRCAGTREGGETGPG